MAAAVGQGVHGDLPMAPRYQLYKSLAMKIYGTNGNVDDSAAPFDHSMTRDLSIRPHLPFCVDISLCTSEETAQRMRRYFQVTHETGNFYQQQGGESGESTPPLPPGWIDVGGGGDETTTAEEGGGILCCKRGGRVVFNASLIKMHLSSLFFVVWRRRSVVL